MEASERQSVAVSAKPPTRLSTWDWREEKFAGGEAEILASTLSEAGEKLPPEMPRFKSPRSAEGGKDIVKTSLEGFDITGKNGFGRLSRLQRKGCLRKVFFW